jgi:hypothetical protein
MAKIGNSCRQYITSRLRIEGKMRGRAAGLLRAAA